MGTKKPNLWKRTKRRMDDGLESGGSDAIEQSGFSIALCFWASHIATAQVALTDSTQVSADHTEVTGQMVYYSGHVRIRSGNLVIHADGFEWNPEAKEGRIHGAARVVGLEKATAKRPDDTRERILERRFRPQVTLPEIMPPG